MLQSFRESDKITLESMSDYALECLYAFYRVKVVRQEFATPGQHVSSTDTDEETNAKNAAKALQDDTPATNFSGLPEALQALIASFTVTSVSALETVRARLRLHEHSTEDESTATNYPHSPSSSEKSHETKNQQEVNPTGEGAVGEDENSAKRQKTEE